MKEGWKTTTLGEIASIGAGNSAPQDKALFTNGAYPFFRTSDVGQIRFGIITQSRDYLNNEGVNGLRLFKKGTILLPKSGASTFLNHRVMLNVDGYVSSHLATIIGDVSKVDRKFLLFFLTTVSAQDLIQDHAYPSLNLPMIAAIPIDLPPLSEQHRIVTKLDEAFDGIEAVKANTENNIKNARGIFENELNGIFTKKGEGWEEKSLVQIASAFGRGKSRYRPRNAPHLYGGNYPFIQTGDIRNADHNITQYSQSYSDAGLAQSKLWPKGTVCITIAANIAETGILSFDACFPDSVIGVTPNPKEADSGFLEYLLQYFRSHLQKMGKGSAQDNINMGTFEHQRFPFPPIDEQLHISKRLDSIRDESKRINLIYNHKLKKLDDLKKSLLHHAFTGNL